MLTEVWNFVRGIGIKNILSTHAITEWSMNVSFSFDY
jgi:hypothetical protein